MPEDRELLQSINSGMLSTTNRIKLIRQLTDQKALAIFATSAKSVPRIQQAAADRLRQLRQTDKPDTGTP